MLKLFTSGILSTTGEQAASSPVVTWSFHFNSTSPHPTPLLHLTLPFTLAQTYPIKVITFDPEDHPDNVAGVGTLPLIVSPIIHN